MLKSKMANSTKILLIPPILIVLIVLALGPQFLGVYYLTILREIFMWVALSVSWHFFSGLTKYISLGSAAFFGVGNFFTAEYLELSVTNAPSVYPILPLPVIVLLGGLICFAVALGIGLVTLRLKGIYFAILTFGVAMVIQTVLDWWKVKITGAQSIYPGVFDIPIQYYSLLIAMLATLLLTAFLRRSKFGLALKMIGENEEAAVHVGVNASLFKTLGFAISAMCMGFVGGAQVTRLTIMNAGLAFDVKYSFYPAVMTMLGGGATVMGPIVGSITLTLIYEYLRIYGSIFFLIILGSVLVFIVLFMPNGILGVVQKLNAKLMGIKRLAWIKKLTKAPKTPP
jgi:branched-chain amino acid transport system permease protein